jgi:hypothetical protein
MDVQQLYDDYGIPFADEEDKHYHNGWVNTSCPFCGDSSKMHLGYHIEGNYFNCWRCGKHSTNETLSIMLNVSTRQIKEIILLYDSPIIREQPKIIIRKKAFKLPSDISPLLPHHEKYLAGRGFDPKQLEREWGLMGTGPMSFLDDINYSHRIIAPIYWNGKQVSFQGRDVTNHHPKKYMACPIPREIIHHKHILYGKQEKWTDTGVCVEGITDVWRFGYYSFAVFGIEYTLEQVRVISKAFHRVMVIFDGGEVKAQEKASKLVSELKFRGMDVLKV